MDGFLSQTFLIERLFGVFSYVIVIGITYISLIRADKYKFNRTLNTCLLVLCFMAFLYVPASTHDLARIWRVVESWESVSFDRWTQVFLSNTNSPGAYMLYYLIAKMKTPRLLPVLACLMFFSTVFYILKCEYRNDRASSRALAITFFFIMCQGLFLGAISGVRSDIAFSLVLRATYDDLCLKKKSLLNYVLCGIAITFHISTILVIGIYLVFFFFFAWKNGNAFRKFTSTVLLGFVAVWGIRSQSDLFDSALGTARAYFYGHIYSYLWEYIIVTIAFVLLCSMLVKYRKVNGDNNLRELYGMCVLLSIVVIIMFRSYTMFHRFANYTMLVSIPIVAVTLDELLENNYVRNVQLFKIICFMILMLACARGDLCGYKFFVL